MKTNIISILTGVAVLALAPTTAFSQENQISYPSEGNAVLVIEQRGGAELRAGSAYDYSFHVRNESDQPLHGVKVYQTLSSSFEIEKENISSDTKHNMETQGAQQPNQRDDQKRMNRKKSDERSSTRESAQQADGQKQQQAREKNGKKTGKSDSQNQMTTRVWSIGMIAPQEERVIRITGIPTRKGELKSCVSATFDRSLCTTLEVIQPELSLVRQWIDEDGEVKDKFFICDPINIRYTIHNEGSGSTKQAVITEELPEGFTTEDGKRKISIDAGDLEAGQSETFTVAVKAKQEGEFSSRATAGAGKLSSQSNAQSIRLNRAQIGVSVECRGSQHIGRDVECHITVQNLSDEVIAHDTKVSIPGIDQRLRFASIDQNIPADADTFNLGNLAPGEGKSFSLVFSSDEAGDVSSKVVATAYCAENATATFKTNFKGIPALQIIVVDQKDPVEVDGETVYEISVLNEGSARDANIILTGELPDTLKFVSATGDSKVEADGNKLSFSRVKELEPGDSASWLVTVRGVKAGKDELNIELKSDSGSTSSGEPTTVY